MTLNAWSLFGRSREYPMVAQYTPVVRYSPVDSTIGFFSGTSVISVSDVLGSIHAATTAGTNGPELETAGMLSDCFHFLGAPDNDTLSMSGAGVLGLFNGAPAISFKLVVKIGVLAGDVALFQIVSSISTKNRAAVLVRASTRRIRVFTTRDAAIDSSVTTESVNALVPVDVPTAIYIVVDPRTGRIYIRANDNVDPGIAVTWISGLGLFASADSAVAPVIGRVTGSPGQEMRLGDVEVGIGTLDEAAILADRLDMQALYGVPIQSLTIDPPADSRDIDRFYRARGTTAIPLSGTVFLGADDDIELRLVDDIDRTTEAAGWGWQTVTTSASQIWSVADLRSIATVPPGRWRPQVRKAGELIEAAVFGPSAIHVGEAWLFIGQSGAAQYWVASHLITPYASSVFPVPLAVNLTGIALYTARTSGYLFTSAARGLTTNAQNTATGEPAVGPLASGAGGNGLMAVGEEYRSLAGSVACMVAYATGNTGHPGWLSGGSLFEDMQLTIDGPGGIRWEEIEGVFHAAHEWEVKESVETPRATYKVWMAQEESEYRTLIGRADAPFFWRHVGSTIAGSATDDRAWNARQAVLEYLDDPANPDSHLAYNPCFVPRNVADGDTQHPVKSAYPEKFAPQLARAFAHYMYLDTAGARGTAINPAGPQFLSGTCVAGTNTLTLTATHPTGGGTSLEDSSGNPAGTGLTQFDMLLDGRTVTAGVISGNTVVLTFSGAAAVSGDVFHPRHQYGRDLNCTNCVFDENGAPAQVSRDALVVTVA